MFDYAAALGGARRFGSPRSVQTCNMARRGWWRRPPFLPLPVASWFAFSMETAYGDANALPSREDVVEYVAWHRQFHKRPVGAR